MQQDKPVTIFVRKNTKKTLEKHPTHNVTIIANEDIPRGTKLYGALWPKTGQDGDPFFAGSAEYPQQQQARPAPQQQRQQYGAPRQAGRFIDDEIPF